MADVSFHSSSASEKQNRTPRFYSAQDSSYTAHGLSKALLEEDDGGDDGNDDHKYNRVSTSASAPYRIGFTKQWQVRHFENQGFLFGAKEASSSGKNIFVVNMSPQMAADYLRKFPACTWKFKVNNPNQSTPKDSSVPVAALQVLLGDLGFYKGPYNAKFEDPDKSAIRAFETTEYGASGNGKPTTQKIKDIVTAWDSAGTSLDTSSSPKIVSTTSNQASQANSSDKKPPFQKSVPVRPPAKTTTIVDSDKKPPFQKSVPVTPGGTGSRSLPGVKITRLGDDGVLESGYFDAATVPETTTTEVVDGSVKIPTASASTIPISTVPTQNNTLPAEIPSRSELQALPPSQREWAILFEEEEDQGYWGDVDSHAEQVQRKGKQRRPVKKHNRQMRRQRKLLRLPFWERRRRYKKNQMPKQARKALRKGQKLAGKKTVKKKRYRKRENRYLRKQRRYDRVETKYFEALAEGNEKRENRLARKLRRKEKKLIRKDAKFVGKKKKNPNKTKIKSKSRQLQGRHMICEALDQSIGALFQSASAKQATFLSLIQQRDVMPPDWVKADLSGIKDEAEAFTVAYQKVANNYYKEKERAKPRTAKQVKDRQNRYNNMINRFMQLERLQRKLMNKLGIYRKTLKKAGKKRFSRNWVKNSKPRFFH